MALLNIGSEDPNLRLAAYNLLVALSLIFNFDVGNQLLWAKGSLISGDIINFTLDQYSENVFFSPYSYYSLGLCIPANNTSFVVGLSERLAQSEPHLTPDFLTEFFVGFNKSSTPLKHLCLQYMSPWLYNLAHFCRNGPDNQKDIERTREIIRHLIELTVKETEVFNDTSLLTML